jgi:hypothetical protein
MAAVNFFSSCLLPGGRRRRVAGRTQNEERKAIKEKKMPASHRMKNKPWFRKTMVFES